jgi:hypothetical protein
MTDLRNKEASPDVSSPHPGPLLEGEGTSLRPGSSSEQQHDLGADLMMIVGNVKKVVLLNILSSALEVVQTVLAYYILLVLVLITMNILWMWMKLLECSKSEDSQLCRMDHSVTG